MFGVCKGLQLLIIKINYTAGGMVVWRDMLTVEDGKD